MKISRDDIQYVVVTPQQREAERKALGRNSPDPFGDVDIHRMGIRLEIQHIVHRSVMKDLHANLELHNIREKMYADLSMRIYGDIRNSIPPLKQIIMLHVPYSNFNNEIQEALENLINRTKI